jgi:hypothetical protein
MKRSDLTSKISLSKFRVGRFVLNEYEVREMIARVAEGTLNPEGIVIVDEDGNSATIYSDGRTSRNLSGFDKGGNLSLRKIRANRLKLKNEKK